MLLLMLLMSISAWAQVTQYKYHITVNVNDGWSEYVFFLDGNTYNPDNNDDIILSDGEYWLNIGGYYENDGGNNEEFDDYSETFTLPTTVNQSVNVVTDHCNVTVKCIAIITSYSVTYAGSDLTGTQSEGAWVETMTNVARQGETASIKIHSHQNYTLRHLYMREEGGNETELTIDRSTYEYTTEYEEPAHSCYAGTTVNRYEASFTMPAKNVTIRAVFNKKTPTVTPPTAITGLVYNGQPQALINAGSTTGGTMLYSLEGGNWGTAIPTATDAYPYYYVYYKVVGNDEYEDVEQQDFTVSIAKATNTITPPTARSLIYNGKAQTLLNAGSATFGTIEYSLDPTAPYSTTIPKQTNATPNDYYTVWYKVDGDTNYTGGAGSVYVPIAQCPVTVTVTGHTLTTTYDLQEHSVSGFDVSMSNNLYTTSDFTYKRKTEASGSSAGEYTEDLYALAFSNSNENFEPTFVIASPVRLVIQQKPVVVTADDETKEQGDDDALTVTVTGLAQGHTKAAISYSISREAGEDIGTYTITPTGKADQGNYSVTFVPGTLTITPKTIAANPDDNGNYWATYYNGTKSYTADDNTTVYKGARDGNKVLLTPVADIPADNAVILKSTTSPITLTLTTTTSADFTGNDLQGRDHEVDASGMSYAYCLSKGVNGVGFYKYTGKGGSEIIPAHRAFLEIGDSGSNAPAYKFLGFDEEETSLTPALSERVGDGAIYDLSGRKVAKPTKGMYIVNGNKVFIK